LIYFEDFLFYIQKYLSNR